MARPHVLSMLAPLMLLGCARTEKPVFALDPNALTPLQRTALDLAVGFARDQDWNWGRPIALGPLGPGWDSALGVPADCYKVRFFTPDEELARLGDRAIFVNVKTGKAIPAPRD